MAGVTAVALASALLCVVTALGGALPDLERLRGAADAGALAAADLASGRVAGVPCEVAAAIASRAGARLSDCAVSGDGVAEVTVAGLILDRPVEAAARAGPPP